MCAENGEYCGKCSGEFGLLLLVNLKKHPPKNHLKTSSYT